MAPLANMLGGILALSGVVSAGSFRPIPGRGRAQRVSRDLIDVPLRDVNDDAVVIRSSSSPTVLKPIRPTHNSKVKRTSRKSDIQLLNEDYLYWGGEDGTMAELRVDTSGEKEGFLDTEYFSDLIDAMECPQNGTNKVSIKFSQKLDFDDAADVWKWVGEEDDNEFILMVGDGDCGWNEDRLLYHVTDLQFVDATNTAIFKADPVSWKDALHTYDLNIGQLAAQNHAKKVKRGLIGDIVDDVKDGVGNVVDDVQDGVGNIVDGVKDGVQDVIDTDVNKDFEIPFDIDTTGKGVTFSMNGVDYNAHCSNCTTKGNFKVQAKFRMHLLEVKEAVVELSTEGIDTTVILGVTVKGELTDSLLEKSLPLFKASPAGVAIPGVITLGPTVTLALKAGIGAIKGGVTLTLGGTAAIPSSKATLDFLSQENTKAEGWKPDVVTEPLKADVFVEARAATSLTASVGLEISAVETGFAAELSADLPSLAATLKAIHSLTCTACSKYENAIQGTVTLGTSISVGLKKKVAGTMKALWSLSLYDSSLPPLASFCEAVGPQSCDNNATALSR